MPTEPHKYACARDHQIAAWVERSGELKSVILTGYLCPVCIGAVKGHETMIDSRILAPVQEFTDAD